jgi:hypothetical protein
MEFLNEPSSKYEPSNIIRTIYLTKIEMTRDIFITAYFIMLTVSVFKKRFNWELILHIWLHNFPRFIAFFGPAAKLRLMTPA